MNWTFRDVAPGLTHAVEQAARLPFIRYVNETVWIFAIVETAHLVFLAIVGGAVFALNLRLLGVVLLDAPEQAVERATRPWLRIGIAGAAVTGVAMGLTTANTLMPNAAFFVKMLALLAAILLSLSVSRSVRHGDAAAGRAPLVLIVVSGVIEFRANGGASLVTRHLRPFASILTWITVAAAGRWIGFS